MEQGQDVLIVCKDVLYAMQQFVRHVELDIQLILRKLNAFLIALMLHISLLNKSCLSCVSGCALCYANTLKCSVLLHGILQQEFAKIIAFMDNIGIQIHLLAMLI